MPVKVTWHGHAAFTLDDGVDVVLIDPWFTGNPAATCGADEVAATLIVVTHGHRDHLGDAVEISRRVGAPILAINELAIHLGRTADVQTLRGNIGGTLRWNGVAVKLVAAVHTSAIDTGDGFAAVTAAAGVVVRIGDKTIYHAGDTALFGDMRLIGDEVLDAAIVPIGGTYTMDARDAARAVELLRPGIVIPNHFDTFPQIRADPQEFADRVGGGARVKVLRPGGSLTI